MGSILLSEVQEWVSTLDRSPSTVKRAHACLAQVLDMAVADRRLAVNPARGVSLPRKRRAPRIYLTMDQVRTLTDEVSKNSEIVWLLATTGMRWSEMAGMKVGDINFAARRVFLQRAAVTVGSEIVIDDLKAHDRRKAAVPRFVCNMLEELCEGKPSTDWVWEKAAGGPLFLPGHGSWYHSALERLRAPQTDEEAEAEKTLPEEQVKARADARYPWITPHGLRHVAAGLLVSSGASVKVIQRQLGHASAAMTLDTYADLWDGDLDVVADAMEDPHVNLGEPKMSHRPRAA